MARKIDNRKAIYAIIVILVMVGGTLLPLAVADTTSNYVEGFEKGIPWQPFKPLKRVTFVQFDKETLIDDYSYLASIPASVFSDGETLFTSPLLFFQPPNTYPEEDKYRFLNDYPGTQYLMEDWMSYCYGRLDKLTTINVDNKDLDTSWKTQTHLSIDGDDPYQIAAEIALNEWSYSNEAVIAVIEEDFETPEDTKITGKVSGEISGEIGTDHFTIARPYGPAPEYKEFTIEDQYKYVEVDLWYPSFLIHSKLLNMIPGFGGAVGITIPSVDPDLQIACKYEDDWLQTSAASNMALTDGPHEECLSYVYQPGDWRVGVTNMPTEGGVDESILHNGLFGKITRFGSLREALRNTLFGVTSYYIDIIKYPGIELEIPDIPPFGCRDAAFTLTWAHENVNLGFTLLGPSGEELDSIIEEDVDSQEITLHMLGECLEGEHYNVVVFALGDVLSATDFTVEYSWQQNITRKEGDLLASACEGAILGSITNNPLLYVTPEKVPECTTETLCQLGVNDLHVVDLGGYLSKEAIDSLSQIAKIKMHYTEYIDIYNAIMDATGSNDVVFSTIDPWSYWYYKQPARELQPDGEYPGAFYFGPAAYAAAHHGTPLLLVDNHPELSGAVMWHVDFWQKHPNGVPLPPIACMFLTGNRVYDFLEEYGFDQEGAESILTVAGQYDIGPTWCRVFAGVANPGSIIGTPVDVSNHITRCIFYPGLIYQNPALQGQVELINGSISERAQPSLLRPFQRIISRLLPSTPGLSNLKIIRPSGPDKFEYPILNTYGIYSHRFNERASEYWGTPYQTRTGYTPGKDISGEMIDQGVREKYEGKFGSFIPDLSDSEIGPFYASKAGYSNAFSTDFEITIENLNKGVISWHMVLHGDSGQGGILAWWNPMSDFFIQLGIPSRLANIIGKLGGAVTGSNPYEANPWRGYDMLWGSTEEPDTATLNSEVGFILGLLGIADPDGPLSGGILKTGLDIVPSNIPFKIPLLNKRQSYYDGLVGPYSITAMLTKFHYSHPATEVDDKLENLHSMNFHAGSCLIGCNYFQIALMRHGSVLQECDPWVTSYWGGYAGEQVSREYALGETAGETYAKGITEIGVKYLFEDDEKRIWWWDTAENMVLFTDPDLRVWVPSTEYDEKARNHWEQDDIESLRYDSEFNVDGHMPFGVNEYPNVRTPMSFLEALLWIIVIVAILAVVIIGIIVVVRRRRK